MNALSITTILITAVQGAIVGSFLNVVIHRLPALIDYKARCDCDSVGKGETPPDGIAYPGSRCPQCGERIHGLHNIPVLSWLLLRGQARCCGGRISAGYPAIEAAMAVLAVVVVALYGITLYAAAFGVMTAMLLAMSVIDARTQYLPDVLTLPGLWLGLLASLLPAGIEPTAAILGAAAGYLLLWGANAAYRALRGVDGLGYGDFKLLALIGAWGGVESVTLALLIAPFAAIAVVIARIPIEGLQRQTAIAFGPYLAVAGWVAIIAVTALDGELIADMQRLIAEVR